jgi:hypothetical protein
MSETAYRNSQAITRVVASAQTPEQALRGLAAYQAVTAGELADAEAKLTKMKSAWGAIKGTLAAGDIFTWQTQVASAEETVEGLRITMANLAQTMEDIRTGSRTVGRANAAGRAAAAAGPGDLSGRITARSVAAPGLVPLAKPTIEGTPELSLFTQQMDQLAAAQESAHTMAALLGSDYVDLNTQTSLLLGSMQALADQGIGPTDARMQGLADRLREVQYEADLVVRQQQIMAEVGAATGEILNAAFGAGIGQLAANKAKQNAIMAAEQAVMGAIALLNPFTAPLAGEHFAAAAHLGAIAAAWGGLAGATGGFSAGGGRGGGFGGGRTGVVAGQASERAQVPGPEVSIHFDGPGFDAVNPRVQRIVHAAATEAANNYGSNTRVRVFRGNVPVTQGGSGR